MSEYLSTDLITFFVCLALVIYIVTRPKYPTSYIEYIEDLLSLTPRQFEFFCAEYLRANGYEKVEVTQASNDGGKDIVAYKNKVRFVVECKRYQGCVGRPIIQKLHSVAMTSDAVGMVMTTGHYSDQAKAYAKKCAVLLIDNEELARFNESLQKSQRSIA